MKKIGLVHGSAEQAMPLMVGKDTVYIHTDIKKIGADLYQYTEIQYTKDEYITMMAQTNSELFDTLDMILSEIIPSLTEE